MEHIARTAGAVIKRHDLPNNVCWTVHTWYRLPQPWIINTLQQGTHLGIMHRWWAQLEPHTRASCWMPVLPQKTHARSGRWSGKVTTQNKWQAQQWISCAWQLAQHSRALLLGHLGCHRMRKGKAASGELRWREKIWAVFLLIRGDVLEAVLVRILQIKPLRNS